jgi:carboxyl-terminal processing protease
MSYLRWTYCGFLSCFLMCSVTFAASVKTQMDDLQQPYMEVPVDAIQQFVLVYGTVKDNYVSLKNDDELFQNAIQGLLSGLDRYSRYLSPEEYKQLVQYTEGELASTDFDLKYDPQLQQWLIDHLSPDSDSAKQGLRNGVTVHKINQQELKKMNHDQVRHLLTGALGSRLELQLSPTSLMIPLVRNTKIETDIRAQVLKNQVLVLHVNVFQQNTANEIKRLIEQYEAQGIKAVLIDLRNNPGGLLSAAVESADLFLNQGVIVTTRSRTEGDQEFQALLGSEFNKIKLGILINQGSASAAEVFTAALQDHGRAWVVGEKSYGKGMVQKLFPLNNGAALQMTVSHYYTPRGQTIESKGIQPNQVYALQADMKEESYLEHVSQIILQR